MILQYSISEHLRRQHIACIYLIYHSPTLLTHAVHPGPNKAHEQQILKPQNQPAERGCALQQHAKIPQMPIRMRCCFHPPCAKLRSIVVYCLAFHEERTYAKQESSPILYYYCIVFCSFLEIFLDYIVDRAGIIFNKKRIVFN